jgi:hypothetical protein
MDKKDYDFILIILNDIEYVAKYTNNKDVYPLYLEIVELYKNYPLDKELATSLNNEADTLRMLLWTFSKAKRRNILKKEMKQDSLILHILDNVTSNNFNNDIINKIISTVSETRARNSFPDDWSQTFLILTKKYHELYKTLG